jgi:type II secretory pathway pseudopilin PulG
VTGTRLHGFRDLDRNLDLTQNGMDSGKSRRGAIKIMSRIKIKNRLGTAAFTMVEIAIALGIIAFALVAIIGVLPAGMKVQRENREDTIVNQDGAYLLEAIRSGSRGVDELTNYVEMITVQRGGQRVILTNTLGSTGGSLRITNAQHIVSLLSTPKVEWLDNGQPRQTSVSAIMRAISGGALEKSRNFQDFAFRYEVTTEVLRVPHYPSTTNLTLQGAMQLGNKALQDLNLYQNLYDVRLTIRWPILPKRGSYEVGRYRRTFRTLVSGELTPIYTNSAPVLYLFEPSNFTSAH